MAMETHNRVVYEGDPVRQEERQEPIRQDVREKENRDETLRKTVAGGTAFGGLAGLAAVVLAIIGLSGLAAMQMACIASIVAGAALLAEGGFSTAWFSRRYEGETSYSAELLGGTAGVVLGILALIGINAEVLLPIAVLAIGASLFLSSWSGTFGDGKFFVGAAGIVLGILALVGLMSQTLVLVGFLCLGFGIMLSGSALSGKLMYSEHAH
jgi:hypothetical protein